MVLLGINVDHVATVRQARAVGYPDPVEAAMLAIKGGADQITIHLREDRRHIQDMDLEKMRNSISLPLNLEMAASDEIVNIACRVKPSTVTLVPEKREELTTEGGLDVASDVKRLKDVVARLKDSGILVSMFIDPEESQVEASIETGAGAVEFHTGRYCDATNDIESSTELERLVKVSRLSYGKNMKLCAGHGLNYENAERCVKALPQIAEYNIGHSIVARAVYVGMERAVREMKSVLQKGAE